MTETGIALELNDEEKDFVQEVLKERQRTLLMEISHTDHHEFKAKLRKKAEVLEGLLNRFLTAA